MVRAKFKVNAITQRDGGQTDICMTPVSTGSEENKKFWQYTPCGEIKFTCVNTSAVDEFTVGKEYYVDFTLVDAASEKIICS